MKKKQILIIAVSLLTLSITLSSCLGSFALTKNLLSWNRHIDTKYVNELVFVALCIVPVYPIAVTADAVILNSIEFWSGINPVASVNTTKTVNSPSGNYAITTKKDGYHIEKADQKESVDLIFDQKDKSWNVTSNGQSYKLFRFIDDGEVRMYLPNGKTMDVKADAAGLQAFRHVAAENAVQYALQ